MNKRTDACKYFEEAKLKISLDYFGRQRGFQRDFENEIDKLKSLNCN